ncbi:folate-binding protein YgfZ [Corynebacterium sp. ES2715-CONJ3]|uniref:CAF17-like 4Fe-4S cluster assembly/insertion protein YgfZ n=1 Tax=Corynebacterium sp. ES2715-CONJ3 TaxID=2974028 RepID=UPI002166C3D7|nr:folate-binding protein [Corynebacterium sp. ES2715-CONJ3]MCS4491887.1 folate-binding protein [Corynebacterium sp. ES2715-CONJ3]
MSLSSPLLSLPGAQELPDAHPSWAHVAWHYGDPLSEQRYLESQAFVDRWQRGVVEVAGPDANEFLNNLLSQEFLNPTPDTYLSALDLSAQGRIINQMDVLYHGGVFYLDSALAEQLYDYLHSMIFWSQVEVTMSDKKVLSVFGGYAGAHPHRQGPFGRTDVLIDSALYRDVVDEELRGRGYQPVGLMAYEAWRVRHVMPDVAQDLDATSIPHESPHLIEYAVHLNKGCYRGQETVARVENLGRSPRVIVMVHLDGSAPELPAPGMDIAGSRRTVGRIGTVVHDCDYGPIALAAIKRSALDGPLRAGECALSVDPDSIPPENNDQAGRRAIERLRNPF